MEDKIFEIGSLITYIIVGVLLLMEILSCGADAFKNFNLIALILDQLGRRLLVAIY